MAALSERKIEIVRTLVEQAPDRVVGSLRQALAETGDESALGGVKRLVEVEAADRTLRNTVLQPIAPMCVAGGDDPAVLTFPSRSLALIWRALKATEPEAIEKLRKDEYYEAHKLADAQDQLAAAAAAGLRERAHPDYIAAAELADRGRDDGAKQLIAALEIGSVVRRTTQRMPEWLAHPGGDTTAGARLAYKDAVAIADDAGALFFRMLAAQMAQPWMVMRIISAVMDKPTERYLRDSELADFGERLLADIDASIAAIGAMNAADGAGKGRIGARLAELVVHQIMEMEGSVELPRDQGWGLRVVKQRASLAAVVEARLKEGERAVIEALPMFAPRNQRVRHQVPRLSAPPEERWVTHATTLLAFSEQLRTTANYGGFSTARNKMIEKLGEYIDHYVESVVDLLHTDEVEDRAIAAAFLECAANFSQLLRGDKAADLIRRRAHAALNDAAQRAAG
jgi:hypothetical protein